MLFRAQRSRVPPRNTRCHGVEEDVNTRSLTDITCVFLRLLLDLWTAVLRVETQVLVNTCCELGPPCVASSHSRKSRQWTLPSRTAGRALSPRLLGEPGRL